MLLIIIIVKPKRNQRKQESSNEMKSVDTSLDEDKYYNDSIEINISNHKEHTLDQNF